MITPSAKPRAAALRAFLALCRAALRLVALLYRLDVRGAPPAGGGVLASNHVSLVDAPLIAAAARAPVLFLAHRMYFSTPLRARLLGILGALPIAETDSPRELARTLGRASDHARAGGLVCIFAEGSITRTGMPLAFQRGLELIARRSGAPIVPLHIDGLWGSLFSFAPGPGWRKLLRGPPRATISFGAPLAADTPCWRVEREVRALSAERAIERSRAGASLALRFLRRARRAPWRAAVADSTGLALSYGRLALAALALSRALRRLAPDEPRVGVLLPPSAAGAIADLAVALAGRSCVNLNYTQPDAELAALAERAGVRTLITSRRFLAALGRGSPLAAERGRTLYVEDLRGAVRARERLFALAACCFPSLAPGARAAAESELAVLFSSGSTASPKGVVLTHANVAANIEALTTAIRLDGRDRVLGALPFFHAFGYGVTLWAPLCSGAGALYLADPFDAQGLARLARERRATLLLATPTFYQAWMRRAERADFASVRLAVCGAHRLPPALADEWRARYGFELFEGYGATELSPVACVNLPDWERGAHREVGHKPGTVGRPLPGVALRVVDPESGAERGPGERGHLLVRAASVFERYLDAPAETARALADGWYRTGDLAVIDADGFVELVDRLGRFSKIGGEMVSHGRVEEALQSALRELSPAGAADVELAVTAVDDARGERLAVVHTPLPVPSAELWRRLQASALPRLGLPRPDAFVEAAALPHLGSGKPDLARIRELARAALSPRD